MLTYRLCEEKDRELWIRMNREFMSEELQDDELWNGADAVSDEQFAETFSVGLEASDNARFLLFENDGDVIGFANLMIIFSVWSHGYAVIIDDLYLEPNARGQGFGKEAMQLIEEYAKAIDCKRIQFQSELTNPNAMEFYKAIGYKPADMKFYVKYL